MNFINYGYEFWYEFYKLGQNKQYHDIVNYHYYLFCIPELTALNEWGKLKHQRQSRNDRMTLHGVTFNFNFNGNTRSIRRI